MFDPYRHLGVARDALHAHIKSAYRKLVVVCHPDHDSTVGAGERFDAVIKAWKMLETPDARAATDAALVACELQQQELLREQEETRRREDARQRAAAYFVDLVAEVAARQAASAKAQQPRPVQRPRSTQGARVVMTTGTIRCPHCRTQLRVRYATHVKSLKLTCANCLRPFPAAIGQ